MLQRVVRPTTGPQYSCSVFRPLGSIQQLQGRYFMSSSACLIDLQVNSSIRYKFNLMFAYFCSELVGDCGVPSDMIEDGN